MTTRIALRRISLSILAVASVAAAYEAATFSYFSYLRHASPRAANALRPQDGLALLARVNLDVERNPSQLISPRDALAARASLVERPLNEGALRILGSYYDGLRSERRADAAMLLADKVSRRDMLNQLWLIERSVARDDVPGAIRHYHSALSVHPELGGILFPVLSKALAFGEVRNALRPFLASGATWMPAFLTAASTQANISDLEDFTMPVAAALKGETYQTAAATIIQRLAVAGKTQSAFNFAAKIAPDIKREAIENFGLSGATRDPRLGRLSWSLSQADGINSSVTDNGALTASLTPPFSGEVATRDVLVNPGQRYQLTQQIVYEGNSERPQVRWSASCVKENSTDLFWDDYAPRNSNEISYKSNIDVPEGCPVVRFILFATSPDSQGDFTFTINNLRLN